MSTRAPHQRILGSAAVVAGVLLAALVGAGLGLGGTPARGAPVVLSGLRASITATDAAVRGQPGHARHSVRLGTSHAGLLRAGSSRHGGAGALGGGQTGPAADTAATGPYAGALGGTGRLEPAPDHLGSRGGAARVPGVRAPPARLHA